MINYYTTGKEAAAAARLKVAFLVTSYLGLVGKEAHEPAGGVLVSVHESTQKADETSGDHGRASDVGLYSCAKQTKQMRSSFQMMKSKHQPTREVSHGDGDACYCCESQVIQGAEVGHRLCEGRVTIDYWVLGLH